MWFVSRADGLVITDPSTGEGLKGTIKASDWKAHLALIQELRLATEMSKHASDTPAAGQRWISPAQGKASPESVLHSIVEGNDCPAGRAA